MKLGLVNEGEVALSSTFCYLLIPISGKLDVKLQSTYNVP